LKGIDAIKDSVFRPSLMSFNWLGWGGNIHSFAIKFKQHFRLKMGWNVKYDHEELFTFKDGGQIKLQFKGKGFDKKPKKTTSQGRPFIFIIPGNSSTGYAAYVMNIVEEAELNGFDSVVINKRGLAGVKLTTPKFYSCVSHQDMVEPMHYVYKKFC
jgi:predicted alpha/beta-fold hydrolase